MCTQIDGDLTRIDKPRTQQSTGQVKGFDFGPIFKTTECRGCTDVIANDVIGIANDVIVIGTIVFNNGTTPSSATATTDENGQQQGHQNA